MYEARGAEFVLVSLGRDGLPDGTDYWELRSSGITTRESDAVCGDYDADQVFSDLDEHIVCGK